MKSLFARIAVITVFAIPVLFSGCDFCSNDEPSKNHSINFHNGSTSDLHISFSADSRFGGGNPRYERKDSAFVLPVGESFEMINDGYSPGIREPAYAHYHRPSEINARIHEFTVFKIVDSDTVWANLDLLVEERWSMFDNDPITCGPTYHTYGYRIEDTDF